MYEHGKRTYFCDHKMELRKGSQRKDMGIYYRGERERRCVSESSVSQDSHVPTVGGRNGNMYERLTV